MFQSEQLELAMSKQITRLQFLIPLNVSNQLQRRSLWVAKAGALRADISQCANGQHALVMQFMIQSDLNLN